MWRFIVGLLASNSLFTLGSAFGSFTNADLSTVLASAPFTTKPLPQNVVLSLDLRDVPSESTSSSLLGGDLFGGKRDIVETVQLLWQAADDPRVVGMFVDIGDESAGLGRVQELRQAIAHFRGKGKFALGFAESLGSDASGNERGHERGVKNFPHTHLRAHRGPKGPRYMSSLIPDT